MDWLLIIVYVFGITIIVGVGMSFYIIHKCTQETDEEKYERNYMKETKDV